MIVDFSVADARFDADCPASVVDQIVAELQIAVGSGRVLILGNAPALLRALRMAGFDAIDAEVQFTPQSPADRSPDDSGASTSNLPFPNGSFDTIIWNNVSTELDHQIVTSWLRELARMTRRSVYLRVAATTEREPWEKHLFQVGFRKHPNSFRINSYELLERPSPPIVLLMEKVPAVAFEQEWEQILRGEGPGLRDMLLETGRESDAHLIRYDLASRYVRPGDTVLDLACGCGEGLHLLWHNAPGKHFVGIDPRPRAIQYARSHYACGERRLEFREGDPLSLLQAMPAHGVDVVLAFDLLGQGPDPPELLSQIKRVLIPGGRVIFAVARDNDGLANGASSFTRDEIGDLLTPFFLAEDLYQLHAAADQPENGDISMAGRWLRQTSWAAHRELPGQWWIATAISDPLVPEGVLYRETVFAHLGQSAHVSIDYAAWYLNPWVVHSMVHVGYRVKSPSLLTSLAERLLAQSPPNSADYGAALCVLAYRRMDRSHPLVESISLVDKILSYLQVRSDNPHVERWQISLNFALAQLNQQVGATDQARRFYRACAQMDATRFSIHLATKSAESCFMWGWLSLNQGDLADALSAWRAGIMLGDQLLKRPINEILIHPAYPNRFDHGDGMREFVHALESITQCVNGVHLMMRREGGEPVNWNDVHKSFRANAEVRTREIGEAQRKLRIISGQLETTRRDLLNRSEEVVAAHRDLVARTMELAAARVALADRSLELDRAREELVTRTNDLIATREALAVRGEELITARSELVSRAAEFDENRSELTIRRAELVAARHQLLMRGTDLDVTRQELAIRGRELVAARQDLVNVSSERDAIQALLMEQTKEMAEFRVRPFNFLFKTAWRRWFSGRR